jgi:hypothetical protein
VDPGGEARALCGLADARLAGGEAYVAIDLLTDAMQAPSAPPVHLAANDHTHALCVYPS